MKRVLRFWWGDTDIGTMSENRKKCYKSIIRNSGIQHIEMITPGNYQRYEVAEHPIHPAFRYLSAVHQSDYLRAYVTYYHGGGWTDVKYIDHDWNQYFDLLESNPDKMGIGYQEMIIDGQGRYRVHDPEYPDYRCLAMSHFIFRPRTPIFQTYISWIDKKLDTVMDELVKYPGTVHPMVCSDNHLHYTAFPEHLRNYPYPLTWMGLSELFFGAQHPYLDHIMYGMPPAHNFVTGHNHR